MSILIETDDLPERGPLDLHLSLKTTINVSADEARRKVGIFVGNEIADLLSGERPHFVWQNSKAFWRVPVILSSKSFGRIGVVGSVDVDVKNGELNLTEKVIQRIEENAQRFATGAAL